MFRINKSNAFKIIKIKCKVCILDSVFINNSLVRINNFGKCIKNKSIK